MIGNEDAGDLLMVTILHQRFSRKCGLCAGVLRSVCGVLRSASWPESGP